MQRLVIATLTLFVLSGCGKEVYKPESDVGQRVQDGPTPELIVELDDQQAELVAQTRSSFEKWAGGVYDHQAAAVVRAYALNGATAECLEGAGVEWNWQGGVTRVSVATFYGNNVFVAPPERGFTFTPSFNSPAARQEELLRQTPSIEVADQVDSCANNSPGPGSKLGAMSEEEVQDLVSPRELESLTFEWKALMDEYTSELGDPAEVWKCLETVEFDDGPLAGLAGRKRGENWVAEIEKLMPEAANVPSRGEAVTPAWNQVLSGEAQLVEALWDCRASQFGKAIITMPDMIDRFEAANESNIATASRSWARVQELARELGWTPDDPLASN